MPLLRFGSQIGMLAESFSLRMTLISESFGHEAQLELR